MENCLLLAASNCASIQTKTKSTQAFKFEYPVQALNKINSEGTSTIHEDKSKLDDLTRRLQLMFKN